MFKNLLLLLPFIPFLSFSQSIKETIVIDSISQVYDVIYLPTKEKGIFQKKTAVFSNDTSIVAIEKNFSNGRQNGIYKVYYPSGKLRIFTIYANNKINGDWSNYDEGGILVTKGKYQAGIKHGYWAYRSEKCYGKYRNGLKSGKWKCFNQNGGKHVNYYKKGKGKFKDFEKEHSTPSQKNKTTPIKKEYANAINHIARNYYFRKVLKDYYCKTKAERNKFNRYFSKNDNFRFFIAPIIVPTGMADLITNNGNIKTIKIDSILKTNTKQYDTIFSNYKAYPNTNISSYSTDTSSTFSVFFSEIKNNLLRVDLIEYPSTLERDYSDSHTSGKGEKFAILFYFNDAKEVIEIKYQKRL